SPSASSSAKNESVVAWLCMAPMVSGAAGSGPARPCCGDSPYSGRRLAAPREEARVSGYRVLEGAARPDPVRELAIDVLVGLSERPKRLPSRWFYDDEGSRLFERICELPEYYLTRAEHSILAAHAAE